MYKYILDNFLKMAKDERYFSKYVNKDMQSMKKDHDKLKQDNERWFSKL